MRETSRADIAGAGSAPRLRPEARLAAEEVIGRHFQPAELDVCWAGDIT